MNLCEKQIKETKNFPDVEQFLMIEYIIREVLKEMLQNATIEKSYKPTIVEPEELKWMYLEYESIERPSHKAKYLQEHPELCGAHVIIGDQIQKIKLGDTNE